MPKKETTASAISDVSENRTPDFLFIEESGLSEVFEDTSLKEKKICDPPVVHVDKKKSWSSDDYKEEGMEQEQLTQASDDPTVLDSIDSTGNLFVKKENAFGSELLTKLKIEDTESRANHQQEPKIYFCDQCSYKSTQSTNLRKHKEKHHLKIQHNCEECDFSTLTKQYLKIHHDTKHSKVEYNCDVCGFNAKWPSQIYNHKRQAHKDIVLNCDKCDFISTDQFNLQHQ